MKRLKPFAYKGKECRPNQEGTYYDARYQQVVTCNGRCIFILKQPVEHERYDMGGYDGLGFVPYLDVIPMYNRGTVIDVDVWRRAVAPISKAYTKKSPTSVGLSVNGDTQSYDAKLLYDGLVALQSKQATFCFDGVNRAIGFYTDGARFILMPNYAEAETLFDLITDSVDIIQPDLKHWQDNKPILHHLYKGCWGLSFCIASLSYKNTVTDDTVNRWKEDLSSNLDKAKSISGSFDPILVDELNALIQKGEDLLSQEEKR